MNVFIGIKDNDKRKRIELCIQNELEKIKLISFR